MSQIVMDSTKLCQLTAKLLDGHIKYSLGAKVALTARPENIKLIDCSGFVRYLIYNVSSCHIDLGGGGGSWMQNEDCKRRKFPKVDYSMAGNLDGWLRIAFLSAHDKHAGHVWLILNGKTLESYYGKGPGRRPWDTNILKSRVKHCYELGIVYTFIDDRYYA